MKFQKDFQCLQTTEFRRGYTHAVQKGIDFALSYTGKNPSAVVLLNSDIVVTNGWLESLYSVLMSQNRIMMVGPISNAATYQSIPDLKSSGKWATNPLPPGLSVDSLASYVAHKGASLKPIRLSVLNGFCLMLKAEVFNKVGRFDTKSFPTGYGEEVDYSLRVMRAGFKAYMVPSVYLYHTKTASFLTSTRDRLKQRANKILKNRYADDLKLFSSSAISARGKMRAVTEGVAQLYKEYATRFVGSFNISVLYIVGHSENGLETSRGWGSAGLHSMVLMAEGGARVSVIQSSPLVSTASMQSPRLHSIPKVHQTSIKPNVLNSLLLRNTSIAIDSYDVIVSESCESLLAHRSLKASRPLVLYASDHLPPLFTSLPLSEQLRAPYDRLHSCLSSLLQESDEPVRVIVPNSWVGEQFRSRYNASTLLISHPLDRKIYFVDQSTMMMKRRTDPEKVFHLMVNLNSRGVRVNFDEAVKVIFGLLECCEKRIHISIIGSKQFLVDKVNSIKSGGMSVNMSLLGGNNVGFLGNELKTTDILRKCDFFLDLSVVQTSSQLAVEAMACGCVPVLPSEGVSASLCGDGMGGPCAVLETSDATLYVAGVVELMSQHDRRLGYIAEGLRTVASYSMEFSSATLAASLLSLK
eukprot:CAMPEP_0185036334 /NCGR_PEP_ID=MMETSP1103-20130426/29160_1 /TAXON_ID=36769 /ORGANISM="Paraphysomonas bandaiensis, Strain Caron Lab Isolate" /LENGTH=638 /DNA_ID=CAMNT_0027573841 /DNA_START=310 /DNA_END=2226 /DNA_ORIENTATION=-